MDPSLPNLVYNLKMVHAAVQLIPVIGIPEVRPGDDLGALLRDGLASAGIQPRSGVLVVCQKIVSKAEGRLRLLGEVKPSAEAETIAKEHAKDPRVIQVVLDETARIVRREHGVLICETHHGWVCANAGVDLSNVPGEDVALLLPKDADASARRLRETLLETRVGSSTYSHGELGVIISDTFGRPWREGLVDVAIGCAGIAPLEDARGTPDREGRILQVTNPATADQLAAAAGLLMKKAAGIPAVWITGILPEGDGSARELQRDPKLDLFR